MSQREQFLSEWRSHRMSRTALCAAFGISRQTGYKWARRYREDRSIEEKSRRPRAHPWSTPTKLAKLIVSQKKQFPLWGPVPIRARLVRHWPHIQWPSPSTVGSILKKHGLVKARRKRRRVAVRTRPFRACREANDVWCVDFKGQFETRDGRLCYPLWPPASGGTTSTGIAGTRAPPGLGRTGSGAAGPDPVGRLGG